MRLDCGLCIVRDWRPGDKASLVRYANNRNVWRNLTNAFPHPYTEDHADAWIAHVLASSPPTHWAIEIGGEAAGGIGAEPRADVYAKSAHFGYWLGEPFWGRGVMTAAVRATVAHVFSTMDVVRLEAPVFAWNPSSMRVLEKSGFEREGILRRSVFKEGQIIDAVMYASVR